MFKEWFEAKGGTTAEIYLALDCSGSMQSSPSQGQSDMNPAHIIYECLTNLDWGMGYLTADIDEANFQDAADLFFSEGMGLSLLWSKQSEIEDFVADVLKHVDANLRVDITTGKFQIKPIRDDYIEANLLVLDESNVVKVEGLKRTQFGELTNSITVNFWDSETSATGSVTAQDIALARMQGCEINTTFHYEGFTNPELALRAAERNLRVLSTPLWSGIVYANTDAAGLQIGDVFKLNWPSSNINNVVMRVSKVSYGDGVSNTIKLTVTQDVFALPSTTTTATADPDDGWTPPDLAPKKVVTRRVGEACYFELVQQQGQDAADILIENNPDLL